MKRKRITLGIETSCDETSCAVLSGEHEVRSNVIYSQIDLHKRYGGVVPELASRNHLDKIQEVVDEAIEQAGIRYDDIDQIAVTSGPGLIGALLVGLSYGKALAYSLGIPFVGVHHIEGHIAANYLAHPELKPPFLCLVVSGGHTHLIDVKGYTEYEILGKTRDDAAGEAFDKVARTMKLGYPGGPIIDRLAKEGQCSIDFPRAMLEKDSLDFSFSGLKSAVLNYLNNAKMKGHEVVSADVAASFQAAVVDVLKAKTEMALARTGYRKLALAGGVAANTALREALASIPGVDFYFPPNNLCTDNAAMIAAAGYYSLEQGEYSDLDLNAVPSAPIGSFHSIHK
ncbi:MAG: tRNA (adenosine(37)-N6)-threonylcarbamoyltransferase complex transferase subunit TsaD [Bacillota bacterium]|nr:tRNA (adenosine(37)-N6)-threonylcarbamoyltransferase complex transferase subunit TsaD [Bacillota bacterium]